MPELLRSTHHMHMRILISDVGPTCTMVKDLNQTNNCHFTTFGSNIIKHVNHFMKLYPKENNYNVLTSMISMFFFS